MTLSYGVRPVGRKRGTIIVGVKPFSRDVGIFIVEYKKSKCKYGTTDFMAVNAKDELDAYNKIKSYPTRVG